MELSDGASTLLRTPGLSGPSPRSRSTSMGQVSSSRSRRSCSENSSRRASAVVLQPGRRAVASVCCVWIVTVGWLEERWSKEPIIAGAFVVGGAPCSAPRCTSGAGRIPVASFCGRSRLRMEEGARRHASCRGRSRTGIADASSVHDVVYNVARILAAAPASRWFLRSAPTAPSRSSAWCSSPGMPVLPDDRGHRRRPHRLLGRGASGGVAPRRPLGAAEESVEVLKTWLEERNGCVFVASARRPRRDGPDVSRPDAGGLSTVDRERDDERTLP